MSRKIAPHLAALIEDSAKLGLGYWPIKCRKELRALLAVARAAKRLVDVEGRDGPEAVALVKALARLDKLSKGTP